MNIRNIVLHAIDEFDWEEAFQTFKTNNKLWIEDGKEFIPTPLNLLNEAQRLAYRFPEMSDLGHYCDIIVKSDRGIKIKVNALPLKSGSFLVR